MSTQEGEAVELESAIARVYAGPLEEFVQRRDALAKELRAAGRRDDVTAVKALRKPSRTAWALDAAAMDGSGAMERLVVAITATLEAHGGGGDVRHAMDELRQAVRNFASQASRLAAQAGQRIDEPGLANAVLAVIGRPEEFDALRRGRLVDVPEAGGLDFLTSLPPMPPPVRAPVAPAEPPKASPTRAAASKRASKPALAAADDAAEKARAAARRAEIELMDARERSTKAQRAVDEVESKLQDAEERLRAAEKEVRALRDERSRALQHVEAAAARLIEAERAAKETKRAL